MSNSYAFRRHRFHNTSSPIGCIAQDSLGLKICRHTHTLRVLALMSGVKRSKVYVYDVEPHLGLYNI